MKRQLEEDKNSLSQSDQNKDQPKEEIKEPDTVKKIAKGPDDLSKKKVIMIAGYNGSNFVGSQKQPAQDVRTVEGEIEKTLFEQNLISKDNYGDLRKIAFTRATRTDKKVHALQNFFSLKILINPAADFAEYKEKLQKALPKDIKLFALIRGSKRFNTKLCCSSREYLYYLPSFCLQPLVPSVSPSYTDCYNYRIPPELLEKAAQICAKYKGTHKFHNYTRGVKAKEARAKRYIMEFKPERTLVVEGVEFIEFFIKGQSFLYNHIRKMIGMIIHVLRKNLPIEVIDNSFQDNWFITPLAPGNGLMLKRVCYDRYNKVKGKEIQDVELPETDEGMIEDFKIELLGDMAKEEQETNLFLSWLKRLDASGEGDTEEGMAEYRRHNEADRQSLIS
eukprot:TRINITY_DN2259_c0_g3_i1.p2 TRINITY_DN2259_c0_g3~~TRINITY_DN2259_c0_g3_i1.p2  ORF type:complete len:439 (+),score=51.73 TRINITY_DN2259_c0_g3_i1:145-1317(+)